MLGGPSTSEELRFTRRLCLCKLLSLLLEEEIPLHLHFDSKVLLFGTAAAFFWRLHDERWVTHCPLLVTASSVLVASKAIGHETICCTKLYEMYVALTEMVSKDPTPLPFYLSPCRLSLVEFSDEMGELELILLETVNFCTLTTELLPKIYSLSSYKFGEDSIDFYIIRCALLISCMSSDPFNVDLVGFIKKVIGTARNFELLKSCHDPQRTVVLNPTDCDWREHDAILHTTRF